MEFWPGMQACLGSSQGCAQSAWFPAKAHGIRVDKPVPASCSLFLRDSKVSSIFQQALHFPQPVWLCNQSYEPRQLGNLCNQDAK